MEFSNDLHIKVREAQSICPEGYSIRDISGTARGVDAHGYDFGVFRDSTDELVLRSKTALDPTQGDPRWGGRPLSVFDRKAFEALS